MRIVLFAVIALLGAGSAGAAPIPSVDVPAMVEAADLIVVGRAEAVRFANGPAGAEQTFSVAVDRVLKGTRASAGGRVSVRLDLSRPEFGIVRQRRYGVFFLRRAAPRAAYMAANPYHPALAAAPGRERAGSGSADPQAAVVRELTRVLATPPAELAGDEEQAEALYYGAAAALKTMPFALSGPGLRAIADSGGMPGRLWAIECLLTMGGPDDRQKQKVGYLESVEPLLLDPPPELESAAYALATAMEGNIGSPGAVPTLAALLGSRVVEVRRAAASVLSEIATPDAVAPLAMRGLADPDQDVRYFAVLGLAEANRAAKIPTLAVFQENEAAMLRHWRNWARANLR